MRKVFIKGIGMVTPLGMTRDESFANALAAKSAISSAPLPISILLPKALAASVPAAFDATIVTGAQKILDRATQFALHATREAMLDAGFTTSEEQKKRVGVYVGVGMGGAQTVDTLYQRFFEKKYEGVDPTIIHPLAVPRMMPNASAAMISIEHNLRGPTMTYCVACSSSSVALGEAFRALRDGYIDTAIVVGTEAQLTPGSFVAWNALRVMAKNHPQDISQSCRPFDVDRTGFVLGEGAATLILEAEGVAPCCTRAPYAQMAGYGVSTDGTHITLPNAQGQVAAMQAALLDAQLPPDAVSYVNAHGTATDAGDVTEIQSITQAFGTHAKSLAVSSTKSVHGHLIGAGGALEFALSVMALGVGQVPPTAHLITQDPRCDIDCVPLVARSIPDIHAVMSNSFAFGGTNASLIACKVS
jgi:3-oxoacyl-(acyl-carrier-protein) synthase